MGTPARSLRRGGSRPETIAKHRHAGAERDHRDTPDRADEVPAAGVRWRRNPALAWLNRVDLYDGRPVSRRGRELPVAAFPQAQNEQPDMLVGRDALACDAIPASRTGTGVCDSPRRYTHLANIYPSATVVGRRHRGASWRGEPSASTLSRTGWHAMCHRIRPYRFGSRC